jgi:hypothetical protein
MGEEEPTPNVQQNENELEPHLDSHWFVTWCLKTIGANHQAVKDRLDIPWLVLLVLGPFQWLHVILVV